MEWTESSMVGAASVVMMKPILKRGQLGPEQWINNILVCSFKKILISFHVLLPFFLNMAPSL